MSTIGPSPTSLAEAVDESEPILLDLGRQKAKAVKQLRKGRGRLMEDVLSTIEELKTIGTISATAQPVIIVVQERSRVKSLFPMFVE